MFLCRFNKLKNSLNCHEILPYLEQRPIPAAFFKDLITHMKFILVGSFHTNDLHSTLVISKLKGPSQTLRDIYTLTYQIFRIEENTNRTTKFHK